MPLSFHCNNKWISAAGASIPSADEVHIWRADIGHAVERTEEHLRALSPEEAARAERFRFAEGRGAYICGHAILRYILAHYLNRPPHDIRYSYGHRGKPSLSDAGSVLRFNMSDSHGVGLFAFARNREVGADVEKIRGEVSFERIARRHFTAAEQQELLALPEAVRQRAFFHGWCRKEAYIKAIGLGLYYSLDNFTVPLRELENDESPVKDKQRPREVWTLRQIDVADGYCAAVAVEGNHWRPVCIDWRGDNS